MSVALALAFGVGLLVSEYESRVEQTYLPRSLESYKALQLHEALFGATPRVAEFHVRAKDGSSMLRADNLAMALRVHREVLALAAPAPVDGAGANEAVGAEPAVTFDDVCERVYAGGPCVVENVFVAAGMGDLAPGMVEAMDQAVLDTFALEHGHSLAHILGGLRAEGTSQVYATALRFAYVVSQPPLRKRHLFAADDAELQLRQRWEAAFLSLVNGSPAHGGAPSASDPPSASASTAPAPPPHSCEHCSRFEITGVAERSIDDEIAVNVRASVPFVFVALVAIVAFVTPLLGGSLRCRLTLGLGAGVTVALAALAGIGAASFAQVPFSDLTMMVIFVAVGVGVDDVVMVMTHFRDTNSSLPLGLRLPCAMSHAGPAILLTSVTNIVAFAVAALVDLPGVRWFCLTAAFVTGFLFLLTVTFFASILALQEQCADRAECAAAAAASEGKVVASSPSAHSSTSSRSRESALVTVPTPPTSASAPGRRVIGIGFTSLRAAISGAVRGEPPPVAAVASCGGASTEGSTPFGRVTSRTALVALDAPHRAAEGTPLPPPPPPPRQQSSRAGGPTTATQLPTVPFPTASWRTTSADDSLHAPHRATSRTALWTMHREVTPVRGLQDAQTAPARPHLRFMPAFGSRALRAVPASAHTPDHAPMPASIEPSLPELAQASPACPEKQSSEGCFRHSRARFARIVTHPAVAVCLVLACACVIPLGVYKMSAFRVGAGMEHNLRDGSAIARFLHEEKAWFANASEPVVLFFESVPTPPSRPAVLVQPATPPSALGDDVHGAHLGGGRHHHGSGTSAAPDETAVVDNDVRELRARVWCSRWEEEAVQDLALSVAERLAALEEITGTFASWLRAYRAGEGEGEAGGGLFGDEGATTTGGGGGDAASSRPPASPPSPSPFSAGGRETAATDDDFYSRLWDWLQSEEVGAETHVAPRSFARDIVWSGHPSRAGEEACIAATRFHGRLHTVPSVGAEAEGILHMRETIAAAYPDLRAHVTAPSHAFAERDAAWMVANIRWAIATAMGAVLFVLACLLNISSAALVAFVLVTVNASLSLVLVAFDVPVDLTAFICLSISVGLSIDYVCHVAHAFELAQGSPRERAAHAVEEVGAAVFKAAASTALGVLALLFSASASFRLFAWLVLATVLLSCVGALLVFPAAASLFPEALLCARSAAPSAACDCHRGHGASGAGADVEAPPRKGLTSLWRAQSTREVDARAPRNGEIHTAPAQAAPTDATAASASGGSSRGLRCCGCAGSLDFLQPSTRRVAAAILGRADPPPPAGTPTIAVGVQASLQTPTAADEGLSV